MNSTIPGATPVSFSEWLKTRPPDSRFKPPKKRERQKPQGSTLPLLQCLLKTLTEASGKWCLVFDRWGLKAIEFFNGFQLLKTITFFKGKVVIKKPYMTFELKLPGRYSRATFAEIWEYALAMV